MKAPKYTSDYVRFICIVLFLPLFILSFIIMPFVHALLFVVPILPLLVFNILTTYYVIEDGIIKKMDSNFKIDIKSIERIEQKNGFLGKKYVEITHNKGVISTLYINEMDSFIQKIKTILSQS